MAAFEKVPSGLADLDLVLDWIRLGDNVVWQVSTVEEYRSLVGPFAAQALADGRQLIYIRFAPHPPILADCPGLSVHRLDPALGFESFTGSVHRIIANAGQEAFYIFDCLSELQTAWSADLMMGNFFVVTCPYLFELDTVAWFCLLRHRHSYGTIARIRETTQLLIDLYPDEDCLYLHPLKVWQRYSPTMFFPHRLCLSASNRILPLTDGVSVSRFYRLIAESAAPGDGPDLDSWERFFIRQRELLQRPGTDPAPSLKAMAEALVGPEKRFLELIGQACRAEDLLAVKDRMIGSGKIGGKAAGVIVARRIIARRLPALASHIEPHDSFFIGSDVFYTYLVHNRLWQLRMAQREEDGFFARAQELRQGILAGVLPDPIRERCQRMLECFGQNPIIVRSSSLLEDSYGHAFAGKYESIFCVNAGSPEDRLSRFEDALKRVYSSTMDESALAYRQRHGLHGQDEQMAILVQRVSGSLFGDFFMPAAAGVGYSFNNWHWHPDLDPAAGMIRLVLGLGTRAVDRTGSDYPRLVSLDHPELEAPAPGGRASYCQRSVDGLSLTSQSLETHSLDQVGPLLPDWLQPLLMEHDSEIEQRLAEAGQGRTVWLGTCGGLVDRAEILADLRTIMATLQQEYGNPVDIEFTINLEPGGSFVINLLQCRPLQSPALSMSPAAAPLADLAEAARQANDLLLYLRSGSLGPQLHIAIDLVIRIDPLLYYQMPYRDKPTIARMVGQLNNYCRDSGKTALLLAPGRIGTSSPELGLPVSFAEISCMKVLCEVAFSAAGYQPELSYGSHFFQDLVEAEICYAAVSEDPEQAAFHPELLNREADILEQILGKHHLPVGLLTVHELRDLIFVTDVLQGSCLAFRRGNSGA